MNWTPRDIKRLRKALNVSQPGLAIVLAVTRSAVAQWEAGSTISRPKLARLDQIQRLIDSGHLPSDG